MNFCLPKFAHEAFIREYKKSQFSTLENLSSNDRRAFFKKLVGDENAKNVNALFEEKMLYNRRRNANLLAKASKKGREFLTDGEKNYLKKLQTEGIDDWASTVAGLKPEVKTEFIRKVNSIKDVMSETDIQAMLSDFTDKRLGINITPEETTTILKKANELTALKEKMDTIVQDPKYIERQQTGKETAADFKTRMEYGKNKVAFDDYVSTLLPDTQAAGLINAFKRLNSFEEWASLVKSFKSSIDISFTGNQGINTIWNPLLWKKGATSFLNSLKAFNPTLKSGEALFLQKAEVASRVNAINGNYARMKVSLGIGREEAIPSNIPEQIPVLGRLFKVGSDAYAINAVKLRADLADTMIEISKKSGENIKNKAHAEALGETINSMTGRGGLNTFEGASKKLNLYFYSVRLMKGVANTLTAHQFNPKVKADRVALFQARKNLAISATTFFTVMQIYEAINPGSTAIDPRDSHFGQIRIDKANDKWVNVVGPYRPILKVMASAIPTMHDGKWGFWRKSNKGVWTRIEIYGNKIAKFGQYTPLDAFQDFFTGKAAPIWSPIINHWKGSDYSGKPPTPTNDAINLLAPITPVTLLTDWMNGNSSISSALLNTGGFSTTDYSKK